MQGSGSFSSRETRLAATSFSEDFRAEFSGKHEDHISLFSTSKMNSMWPVIFGTSPYMSPLAYMLTRALFATIFLVILIGDAIRTDSWYFLIYLTRWSFIVETVYLVFATYVSYRSWVKIKDGGLSSEYQPEKLPWYVRCMYLLWSIALPVSITVCLAFWTLLHPIWNTKLKLNDPVYTIFEHFVNMLFFLVEFGLSRNAFHLKHTSALHVYAIIYTAFTVVHFYLRLGVSRTLDCRKYLGYKSIFDCPVYPVLDWHHPGATLIVLFGTILVMTLITFAIWCLRRKFSSGGCRVAPQSSPMLAVC